jgi:hypothetical protein
MERMMRTLVPAALALIAGTLMTAAPGRAQEFPYCSIPGNSAGQDCSFSSLEQCRASTRGVGTDCERNPRYKEPAVGTPTPAPTAAAPPAPQRRQTKSPSGTKS